MTSEYTYYLSWTHQQWSGGPALEAGALTFPDPITSLDAVHRVQTALCAYGYHDALVLGFSLLSIGTPG